MVWKEPYGIYLGVVAWNAPYLSGIRSAATAIANGNTVVLKASEMTPRCYWAIGKAFKEAGLPEWVLNVIGCKPQDAASVVNTMIEHSAVKKINFTGSTAAGRKIARVCGEDLKPILIELGGKNSAIMLLDADLEKAARECIAGAFLNAGQVCMGTDRVLIHSSVTPKFLDIMNQQLAGVVESSDALLSVVSSASKSRLANLISEAIPQGAKLVAGSASQTDIPSGASFLPFSVVSATKARPNHKEAFGPLDATSSFETEPEAVELANSTPYGVHAAVFTKDLEKGLSMSKRLEVGVVHINSMTVHDEPALPMGGVKSSGWGRFNAAEGM